MAALAHAFPDVRAQRAVLVEFTQEPGLGALFLRDVRGSTAHIAWIRPLANMVQHGAPFGAAEKASARRGEWAPVMDYSHRSPPCVWGPDVTGARHTRDNLRCLQLTPVDGDGLALAGSFVLTTRVFSAMVRPILCRESARAPGAHLLLRVYPRIAGARSALRQPALSALSAPPRDTGPGRRQYGRIVLNWARAAFPDAATRPRNIRAVYVAAFVDDRYAAAQIQARVVVNAPYSRETRRHAIRQLACFFPNCARRVAERPAARPTLCVCTLHRAAVWDPWMAQLRAAPRVTLDHAAVATLAAVDGLLDYRDADVMDTPALRLCAARATVEAAWAMGPHMLVGDPTDDLLVTPDMANGRDARLAHVRAALRHNIFMLRASLPWNHGAALCYLRAWDTGRIPVNTCGLVWGVTRAGCWGVVDDGIKLFADVKVSHAPFFYVVYDADESDENFDVRDGDGKRPVGWRAEAADRAVEGRGSKAREAATPARVRDAKTAAARYAALVQTKLHAFDPHALMRPAHGSGRAASGRAVPTRMDLCASVLAAAQRRCRAIRLNLADALAASSDALRRFTPRVYMPDRHEVAKRVGRHGPWRMAPAARNFIRASPPPATAIW